MAKGKGKKKGGVPEGTPLEEIETVEMNVGDMKKHAVKMGELLGETRQERINFEIDRDKLMRNLVNTVCQQLLVNREFRRIDRSVINKDNLFACRLMTKVNELAEIRFRQVPEYFKSKNDLFLSSYEGKQQLFLKQDQMFKDRFGLNCEYYKRYSELEESFMASKHLSFCDEMDKLNESNVSKLLWTEKRFQLMQNEIDEEVYNKSAKEMKYIVNKKDSVIENIQNEHVFQCVDILRSFESITKHNFTVISELTSELSNIKSTESKVRKEFKGLREKHDLYCSLIKEGEKEILTIRPVIRYLHHAKAAANLYSKKLKATEEETDDSKLEVDLLQDFIKKDEECTSVIKRIVINEMRSFRQMQVRTHLHLMNIGTKVEEMFADRVRLGKLALCPIQLNLEPIRDLFRRYQCYRLSMIDIVERVMRAEYSNIENLGFRHEIPLSFKIRPKKMSNEESSTSQLKTPTESGVPGDLRPSRYKKSQPPRMLKLMTSLPRVPMRRSAAHLPAIQVLRPLKDVKE